MSESPVERVGKARVLVRIVTVLAALLLLTGAGVLAHPYYTDLQANQAQKLLATELTSQDTRQAFVDKQVPEGAPVTRLLIPSLGVDTVVVEGASDEALRTGAAHYSETPLPGEPGNVGIAGHRTTYGKPFHDLDKLVPGAQAILETPVGAYVYELVPEIDGHENPWIVAPDQIEVIGPTEQPSLTLTTCHPKGSARQRLIARFELVESPGSV